MALAPYYDRAALAAAQVIAGFDADAFAATLGTTTVGLALDDEADGSAEGQALADLAVRLVARLYPRVEIDAPRPAKERLTDLALAINPRLELRTDATIGISLGGDAKRFDRTIYAGSDGWVGRVTTSSPLRVGASENPFGAGVGACLAAGNVFRALFLPATALDIDSAVSAYNGDRYDDDAAVVGSDPPLGALALSPGTALVGLGAIGHATAWALARTPVSGTLHVVDHQTVELSNLQRYVLTTAADVDRPKTAVIAESLAPRVSAILHPEPWASFAETSGQRVANVIVALDSARDRRAVQAALPRQVVNAWTQLGDLGVSSHGRFGAPGACLFCLYVTDAPAPNEDEIVAAALGVPDRQHDVRQLLYSGLAVPQELIDLVAARWDVPPELAVPFVGRPIRELYVEGLCGGALVPLDRLGAPRQEMHVPLAHQSALAGVLLAAAFVRQAMSGLTDATEITRVDVLRPLGTLLAQPRAATERCICRDSDYVAVYESKWLSSAV